jgi:hypothetical protein
MLTTTLLHEFFYGIFEKKFNVGNALVRSIAVTAYSQPGTCLISYIFYSPVNDFKQLNEIKLN